LADVGIESHESRVQAAVLDQECRQAAHLRIHQYSHATLGETADLGDRERERVGRERHRLGVKVAARKHLTLLDEQQRIVGNRIGLDGDRHGALTDQVQAGSHHLWLTAE